jgi:glycosyltransferase involved in cell wall biosynthesis
MSNRMGDAEVRRTGMGREGHPLRVAITSHQGSGAGSVNSVLRLALGVMQAGVQVRCVCRPDSELEAAACAGGLEVHPIPLWDAGRVTNAGRLRAFLDQHPVDLVDSHGSRDRAAFTWLGLTRRLPVPLIITRRSWPRSTRLETWLSGRAANRVVTLSAPVGAELQRLGIPASKLTVIPNGVLLDRIDRPVTSVERDAWLARIGGPDRRRTVGVVARPKDQQVVIAALSFVRTPVRLVLAGLDGPALTDPLRGVPERHVVVRLPFLPDVRPLYDLLEVALHTSRWDAQPQAVLEAMALGKPVLASHATGNAVLIDHGVDGLLLSPTDPRAWGTALDQLLADPALAARLGAAARERARTHCPFTRTVAQTVALYHAVAGR